MRIDIFESRYIQNNKIIINENDKKYIFLRNINNIIIKYNLMNYINKNFIIDKKNLNNLTWNYFQE